ncbi:MAG: 2-polyprenyl-3-methyl-5-hydroxy-6-metoxy-1,4-benzoquinol methylase [Planctomycetaceae bacterium]
MSSPVASARNTNDRKHLLSVPDFSRDTVHKDRICVKYDLNYSAAAEAATYLGRYMFQYKNAELGLILDAIDDGHQVLDYGCNDGWVSRRVKRSKPECEVSGADINPCALARARRRQGGVEYYDARNGDLDGRVFDVVILSHVLEHVHARQELVERIASLTKPDGRLVISVPQERVRGDSTLLPWAMNVVRGRFINPHVVIVRLQALKSLLTAVGFEIERSTYTNLFWPRVSEERGFQSHSLIVQARRIPTKPADQI